MGMTERLLAAWREAEAAAEAAAEGSVEWQRARLAADNASTAYRLHVESVLDVTAHAFDRSPRAPAVDPPDSPAADEDDRHADDRFDPPPRA